MSRARGPRGPRGSHAPSLTTLARRELLATLTPDEKRAGCTLLVGVSGGPDSIALLDALARVAARERDGVRLALVACGVDHGLRAEAEAELRLGAELAARHGVPWVTKRVAVRPGPNLHARAREARHAALLEAAHEASAGRAGATLVATAHHADDRAETFLMRLARGAGLYGLAVLPPREGHLVRPLVRARKADILTHITRHKLTYASDPSNLDPRYLRAKVRAEVVPPLLALDPRLVEHVTAVCDELVALRRDGVLTPSPAGAGRRARAELDRLGPSGPRKMAVALPNGHFATYDRPAGRVVILPGPSDTPPTREPTPPVTPSSAAPPPTRPPRKGP